MGNILVSPADIERHEKWNIILKSWKAHEAS